ncbi:MAG: hypothetical protein ACLQBK_14770 [Candidatus Sulfotelmatobacter sp.]
MANSAVRSLVLSLSLAGLAFSGSAAPHPRSSQSAADDLTVHEWGTFTSIADRDGKAVSWNALGGVYDLPRFIENLHGVNFKAGLRGTIRMETPVMYFYSPSPVTASVHVGFSNGVITEWYPHASHVEPDPKRFLREDALYHWLQVDGSIDWGSVSIEPGATAHFPAGDGEGPYFAARETSSAPLTVTTPKGITQQEKFLFYRGVSAVHPPISALATGDGRVTIRNLSDDEIPGVILFERRGDALGYRVGGKLDGEMQLDPPALTSNNIDSLASDLEAALTAQGLYPDEARAMVETWRTSWFEEGSRLLYIVPRAFVDQVLPLTISPTPSETVRAFVGRIELITPAIEQAIAAALASHDRRTIAKYGRFLTPILNEMKFEDPRRADLLDKQLEETYNVPLVDPPAR